MKKILAITVAFMYLGITSGLVLQIHYCMGRQSGASVEFAAVKTPTCTACGMQNEKNKCCHDELKFVKLQDVHQQVTADYSITAPLAILPVFDFTSTPSCTAVDASSECNHPPDDDDGQPPLFIFHSLFRI